jgi:hypothetical protein
MWRTRFCAMPLNLLATDRLRMLWGSQQPAFQPAFAWLEVAKHIEKAA